MFAFRGTTMYSVVTASVNAMGAPPKLSTTPRSQTAIAVRQAPLTHFWVTLTYSLLPAALARPYSRLHSYTLLAYSEKLGGVSSHCTLRHLSNYQFS